MQTIEIDFEVFKELTNKRRTEKETYNDVLRELLGLNTLTSTQPSNSQQSGKEWVAKGIHFPSGTEFRAFYKGKIHNAIVRDGALFLNGIPYNSPSAAAISITNNSVNGWIFWECRFAGDNNWKLLKTIKELKR